MPVISFKDKDEDIRLVTKGIIQTDVDVWMYSNGTSKDVYPFTVTSNNGFVFINITTPSIDSVLIVKIRNSVEFIKIGNPPMYMHAYIPTINNSLGVTKYDSNGNLLNIVNTVYLGDGIHISPIVDIGGVIYTVGESLAHFQVSSSMVAKDINGKVTLQRNTWQLVAIPIEGKVKDKFLDKLETDTGQPINGLIEVVKAYPGHLNKFLSYVPGFTSEMSEHNFDLIVEDNGSVEINAMWVKTKAWSHTSDDITFNYKE